MTENTIFLNSQKNSYAPTELRANVPADSFHKRTAGPYGFPIRKIKADLFIVDWQLSDDGKAPALNSDRLYA